MKRWPIVQLKDLVAEKSGSVDPAKSPSEVFDLYSIPAFDARQPDVRAGSEIGSAKQVVQPNDVLLSRIVPHIRRAWVVGESQGRRLIASGEWIVFRSPQIRPRYLRYFLIGDPFHAQFMQTVSGVGGSLLRAKATEVAKIKIPVPPLAEQERIVKLLDEADELRKLRAQADRRTTELIPALFHEMFGESRGWPVQRLEKLCERITVGHVGPMATEYCETGIPFLRGQNIRRGFIDLSTVLFVSEEFHRRLAKSAIAPGDVVSVRTGKPGTTAVVPLLLKVANCADLIVITCGPRLNPEFLCELLNQRLGDTDKIAGATGIAQQHFNIGEARKLEVAVPPLSLQKEFAACVSDIRAMQAEQAASRCRLDDLFQSMLYRAFLGEL